MSQFWFLMEVLWKDERSRLPCLRQSVACHEEAWKPLSVFVALPCRKSSSLVTCWSRRHAGAAQSEPKQPRMSQLTALRMPVAKPGKQRKAHFTENFQNECSSADRPSGRFRIALFFAWAIQKAALLARSVPNRWLQVSPADALYGTACSGDSLLCLCQSFSCLLVEEGSNRSDLESHTSFSSGSPV